MVFHAGRGLFALAAGGNCAKTCPAQIKRMLADPRSEAMVDSFTGQWLQARDVEGITIDARAVLARDKGEEKQLKALIASFGLKSPTRPQPRPTNSAAKADAVAQAGYLRPPVRQRQPAPVRPGCRAKNLNPNNVNGRFARPAH